MFYPHTHASGVHRSSSRFLVLQTMDERDVSAIFKDEAAEPWFKELCRHLTEGGETTALCISRRAAVDAWQSLMGPSDPAEVLLCNAAAESRPVCVMCSQTIGVLKQ